MVSTAPIDPPSRTNAGSLPNVARIAAAAASLVAAAQRREVRRERRLVRDHRVGQALLDEALDEVEHLGRLLIGHQARRQLGLGAMGDDGLDAGARVAADDPVHLERRRRGQRDQAGRDRRAPAAATAARARPRTPCARSPRARTPCAPAPTACARRRRSRGSSPGRCARRTSPRAARPARRSGCAPAPPVVPECTSLAPVSSAIGETHQAAQAERDRRLAGGGPDRVGHDDRIGRERGRPTSASPATAAAARRRSAGCRSPLPAPTGTGCWRARPVSSARRAP